MASPRSLPLHTLPLASLLLTGVAASALAQERVGISSAVNPQASGTPPGGTIRRLVIGQDVVFNERITTSDAGQTQLLFLDESAMTIGPNSDLTIDEFVYDPKSGTGKLAMSATRGVLRYVGGKLSKQDGAVTLRSNTATLAVRGGAFLANIQAGGRTEAIFIFGHGLTVTGRNNVSQTVRRPGFHIVVAGPGASPSPPSPVPPGQLSQLVQQLDGRPGGTGGANTVPTDPVVVQSGIARTISGDLPGSVRQAVQNAPVNPGPQLRDYPHPLQQNPAPVQSDNPPSASDGSSISQVIVFTDSGGVGPTVQVATTTSGQPIGGGAQPPPPPPPPQANTFAGRLKNTNGQGTARGFVDQTANGDIPYAAGTLSFPQGFPQNGVFSGTIGGTVGTIAFPLVPGTASFGPQGTSSALGTFTGTSFLAADNSFFYATIIPTTQPTERLFVYGGVPVNSSFYAANGGTRVFAFTVQPDAALQSHMPFIRGQVGGNLPNASVSPLYIVAPATTAIGDATGTPAARGLQASLAVNGQGANQQSAIAVTTGTIAALEGSGQPAFTGQMRGSSRLSANGTPVRVGASVSSTVDANGNSFYGNNAISGFVLDQSAYSGVPGSTGVLSGPSPATAAEVPLSAAATDYGFAQAVLPATVPSGIGATRSTRTITGAFGGLMSTTAQPSPYAVTGTAQISTDAATNRVEGALSGTAQTASAGVSTLTMQFGGLSGNAGGRQAFIDDNTFAALESQANPQLINDQPLAVGGDPAEAGRLYLASTGAAGLPTSLLPGGVSFCQCQYLQWGYWGGDLRTGSAEDGSISRVDRGHINTWVAGVPTPLSDLTSLVGQSATASYTGHAVGSVFNNGANYLAAGGFNGSYSFGTQTATMAISNFDGRSFTATGSAPLSGANYAVSTAAPAGTTTVNGAFYGPMAAETGGGFAFQSAPGLPSYLASGIYAGKR